MPSSTRASVAVATLFGAILLAWSPLPAAAGERAAIAAPPPVNDLRANATVVGALPFTEVVDTTGATTSAEDLSACINPTTASVWYTYTATADTQLVVETLGSDYSTGVSIVYDADPSIFSCGHGNAVFGMGTGVTVSIMISRLLTVDRGNLAVSIHGVAPPSNDVAGAATAISVLPFADVVDVSGATTDADDLQVNDTCGFSLQRTVWYRFTAGPDDTSLLVDTTDEVINNVYPSNIIISTGSPGALTSLACGYGKLAVHTTPGTTYYVLIDNYFGSVPVTVSQAPPEPSFTMSVDGQGTIDHRTGTANLTGTYECRGDGALVYGVLSQTKGSHTVREGFFQLNPAICDGNLRPFSVTAWDLRREVRLGLVLDPFIPGRAAAQVTANVCSAWGCFPFILPPTAVQLVR